MKNHIRITFSDEADMNQVEACLGLSITAIEAITSERALEKHASFNLCKEHRRFDLRIDGPAGEGLLRCFVGYLNEEIGREHFKVSRVNDDNHDEPKEPRLLAVAILAIA